jgi:hypothetical protein
MSDTNAPEKDDGSRRAHSTNPSIPSPSLQAPPERPWLSRARYFLREDELESLTLPGSEGTSAQNTICFSRAFLSKFLGGSQQPAYANIKFDHHHVYHLAAYYVGKPEWNPQFPKGSGVHGALLVVGTSFQMPPVPWPTPKGVNPGDHREKFKPVNCFAKRSSAEYQYIGRYVFHPEFRKLTKEEVERHIPKAACDLWTKGIDTSKWGTKLKSKLVAMNADVTNGDAKHGTTEGKKAEELFDLPDDDPRKLCFYWEV